MPLGNRFSLSCDCCDATTGCCGGLPLADTLDLTVNAGSSPGYQSATITFRPGPPEITTGSGWWSDRLQGLPPGNSPLLDYYYQITPCYLVSVWVFSNALGHPGWTSSGYSVLATQPGNSCSPLLLNNGNKQIFAFIAFTQLNFGNFTITD